MNVKCNSKSTYANKISLNKKRKALFFFFETKIKFFVEEKRGRKKFN